MYALIAFSGIYVMYVAYNEFKFCKANLGDQNPIRVTMAKEKNYNK